MRFPRKTKIGNWVKYLLTFSALSLIMSLGFALAAGSADWLTLLLLASACCSLFIGALVELRSRFIHLFPKLSPLDTVSLMGPQSTVGSRITRERDWVREVLRKVDIQGSVRSIRRAANPHRVQEWATKRHLVQLAVEAGTCRGLLSADELVQIVPGMIEDDPLTAFWLIDEAAALDILPLTARRKLSIELRARGYLDRSLKVLQSITLATHTVRDLRALNSRLSELTILRGEYVVKLGPGEGVVEPLQQHVLHIVGKAFPKTESGYTLRTHYTARALRDLGFQVSVVSQLGETPEPGRFNSETLDGVTYYTLAGSPRLNRSHCDWLDQNIEAVRDLVERIRPALLHAHSDFYNAVTAQAVGDHFGIPVIYENRGFWEESWLSRTSQRYGIKDWSDVEQRWGLPDAYTLRRDREIEVRRRSTHVVTLAEVMKDHIAGYGYPNSQVSVVPNAVSVEDFPVLDSDFAGLRARYKIPSNSITVGYISSVVEYEGIGTLLEAFHVLRERTAEDVRLVIVGDGPHLSDLKELNAELGSSGVTFVGRVPHDEILQYYGLIDIFVVPRRPSRVCELVTPLKPFEAFSTGRTVVMSDVGALKEIAQDSQAAALFRAGDEHSLSDLLVELIENENHRASLARAGAAWVRSERTWASNATRYSAIYGTFGVIPAAPMS